MQQDLQHLAPVGPPRPAPGGTIQTLEGSDGHHVALHFRAELCGHELLQDGMEEILPFVSAPGVDGILPLVAWDRFQGSFAYAVPADVHLLADVLPSRPDPLGALQLIAAIAPALGDAARAARAHGLYAHGGITPWRILVLPDGTCRIIGYGVPPAEVLAWLDEETDEAPDETIPLSPPERIEDQGEDLRSDLFSLGMIAGRIALGRDVLQGRAALVVEELLAGAAAREIDSQHQLDADLRALLGTLLERRLADRPKDTEALADAARTLAQRASGEGMRAWLVPDAPAPAAPEPEPFSLDPDATYVRLPKPGAGIVDDLVPMPLDPAHVPKAVLGRPPMAPSPKGSPIRPKAGPRTVTRLEADPLADVTLSGLPERPNLEQVKEHGRIVVERAKMAVVRAKEAVEALEGRQAELPNHGELVQRYLHNAKAHASRAETAAASASAAADLLDLDDDASGALITLDLVRNGEQQCIQSATEAEQSLLELDRTVERQRQQEQALSDARRRAQENADRASDAADRADEAVVELEEAARRGELGADGVQNAVDSAIEAAGRSHAAAEDARNQAESADGVERSDAALRHADAAERAAQAAETALRETVEAAERAGRLEAEGRQALVTAAADHAATAQDHADAAEAALGRADEALELITSAEASDLRKRCARHASASRRAAKTATRSAEQTERARTIDDARSGANAAGHATREAEEELESAKQLSDEVVAMAGEAAAQKASISKARAEATSLAESARRSAQKARDDIDRLLDDTSGITGARALETRTEAVEFVQTAEHAARRAEEEALIAQDLKDVVAIEERIEAARQHANKARSAAHRCTERAAEARDQAERELAERKRQEAAQQAATQAAAEARSHAERCAELVARAWTRAKELEAILAASPVDDAEALKGKALEIIDIAEFQAGEAAASADMAESESDPAEARAHAQTALSFAERITADLPEAMAALDEAETIAKKETVDLDRSRAHTAEVSSSVTALARGLQRSVDDLRTESRDWSSPAIDDALAQLDALLQEMDGDVTEANWTRDRAMVETRGTDAIALIPTADGALRRAKDKDRKGSALKEILLRAIQETAAEASALDEARGAIAASRDTATDALTRALEGGRTLDEAIATHRADQSGVHEARGALRDAAAELKELARSVAELSERLQAEEPPAKLEAEARRTTKAAEAVLERAVEAETRGIAAAEEEARTRAESQRRRLEAAREEALLQVQRVERSVERMDESLDDAEEQAGSTKSADAKAHFDEAFELSEQARARMGEVERLSRMARTARDADEAETHAQGAREVADAILETTEQIGRMVQEATDLARSAQEDAQALSQVKAEVEQTVARADEQVRRAKAEAKRVLGILREAPRDQVRAVAEQASGHVQIATKAAAKVKAAAPMAVTADALPVAQNILRAARQALQRALEAADAVEALVGDAMDRARAQKEQKAHAVDEARHQAMAPILEAQAEAKKADGWLESGRRALEEHGAVAGVMEGWEALQKAALELQREEQAATGRTDDLSAALVLDGIRGIAAETDAAAKRAMDAAAAARDALQRMRDAGEAHRQAAVERHAAMEAARQELQDHVDTAEQIVEQTSNTLEELRQLLDGASVHHDTLARYTDAATQGATAAREALDRIRAVRDAPRDPDDLDDLEGHADQAHTALLEAMQGLEKVAVCETAFKEKLVKLQAQAKVDAAQQAEAARTEEERAEAARKLDQEDRDRRMAERRERFKRRQDEKGNPDDASTARPRRVRRKSPPAEGEPPPADEAPPRRPRRRRATPENDTASVRGVRSWSPGRSRGDENSTGALPRRSPRPRPQRDDNPNETKADALLERLRGRKNET